VKELGRRVLLMLIWMDILSPKQLLLFTSLAERFKELGHSVLLTSRSYIQLDELLETSFRDWGIIRVGEWGGGSLEGKLRASIERMRLLLDVVAGERPDLCFSSGSPEAARIAYGLGMPHLLISDTPHSPVNRLTAPLSKRVLTPWLIPLREWVEAGASRSMIARYRALDPCFWLGGFKPDKSALGDLEEGRYVLFRMPETQAAYLKAGDREFLELAERIAGILGDMKLIILCRYVEQAELARRILGGRAVIVDKLVLGASLIAFSAAFIGGGGTMTQEASLLGVPAISIYPGELPAALKFLERRKLLVHLRDPGAVTQTMAKLLKRLDIVRDSWRRRAQNLWRSLEDPFRVVLREVESLA
jgi:predicted glycosyltransferase